MNHLPLVIEGWGILLHSRWFVSNGLIDSSTGFLHRKNTPTMQLLPFILGLGIFQVTQNRKSKAKKQKQTSTTVCALS